MSILHDGAPGFWLVRTLFACSGLMFILLAEVQHVLMLCELPRTWDKGHER